MKRLFFIFLLFIASPVFGAGVFGVENPAEVFSVTTPDEVFGVSGLAAGGGKATITYDTSSDNAVVDNATCTVAIDPGDGHSNKIVIIGIASISFITTPVISTVTYDGNACTLIDTQAGSGDSDFICSLYYYLAPADTSKDVVVTMAWAPNGVAVGVISLYNVKQQAPEASNKATGSGTTAATSVTTITDGAMVIDVVGNEDARAMTPDTMDERWVNEDSAIYAHGSTITKESHGAQSMSWTMLTGDWAIVAAAFEAADL
jgi:hypothetical protein